MIEARSVVTSPEATIAQEILAMALRNSRDAELFWASEESFTAGTTDTRPPRAVRREGEGVALRVISAGRVGFAVHVGSLATVDSSALLKEATRRSAEGPEAPPTFWKDREIGPAEAIWDENVAALGAGDVTRLVRQASLRLEDALGPVPRDVAVRRVVRQVALISRTAERRFEKTIFQFRAQVGPLGRSDAVLSDTWASCRLPDDPMHCLADILWRAPFSRDAARTEPGLIDAVLSPRATGTLLRWACGGLTGRAFIDGSSPLLGCLGKRVFDERLTLADDPSQPWAANAAPYDGEGVPRHRHALIERGVLQGLLLDLSSAHKLEMSPSGSAVRAMDSAPAAAPSHLDLAPGEGSLDDMLAAGENGVYVDSFPEDLEPSPNGDFTAPLRAAYPIRGGRPSGWLSGMALVGNVYDLLADHLSAVGGDRATGVGWRCGPIALRDVELIRCP